MCIFHCEHTCQNSMLKNKMSFSSHVTGTLKAEVVGPGSSLPVSLSDNYGQMVLGFVPREEGT